MGDVDVEGGGNFEGDVNHGFVIDELFPDEDERFTESVIRHAWEGKRSSNVHSEFVSKLLNVVCNQGLPKHPEQHSENPVVGICGTKIRFNY
jgi:hypothetical protein